MNKSLKFLKKLIKKILYSLPASKKSGYGHLLRSTVLAKKFKEYGFQNILVGPKKRQIKYINKENYHKYIELNFEQKNFLEKIINLYKKNKCNYLVMDIPKFSIKNQKILYLNKIKWLHFDCDIPKLTYSNQKICSQPALSKSRKKNLYLGINYHIIRDEFYKNKKVKTSLKDIFICFGGGDDNGALYFLLKNFSDFLRNYNLNILLGNNRYKNLIVKILKKEYIFNKVNFVKKNTSSIVNNIDRSFFSINSGGSITHEILSRSKKMLIISIVKNQIQQSKLWHQEGHIYLGDISKKTILRKNFFEKLNIIKSLKEKKFIVRKNMINLICKDAIEIIKKR